jgi:hypothetical protein
MPILPYPYCVCDELLGRLRIFLHKFRNVVQAACCERRKVAEGVGKKGSEILHATFIILGQCRTLGQFLVSFALSNATTYLCTMLHRVGE